jgi:hypothetical protein
MVNYRTYSSSFVDNYELYLFSRRIVEDPSLVIITKKGEE